MSNNLKTQLKQSDIQCIQCTVYCTPYTKIAKHFNQYNAKNMCNEKGCVVKIKVKLTSFNTSNLPWWSLGSCWWKWSLLTLDQNKTKQFILAVHVCTLYLLNIHEKADCLIMENLHMVSNFCPNPYWRS